MSQRAYYALLVVMLAMAGPVLYLTRVVFVIHPVLCWGMVTFCVIAWIPKISGGTYELLTRSRDRRDALMARGFCPKCGLNIGVTADRCPECGNVLKTDPISN